MAKLKLMRRWRSVQNNDHLRLFKNTGLLIVINGFNRLTGLVTATLIGRQLGVAKLGDYSLGMAWAAIIFQIADVGLSVILRRDAARDEEKTPELYSNLLPLYVFAMVSGLLMSVLVGELLKYEFDTRIVLFGASVSVGLDRLARFEMNLFEAREAMEHSTVAIGARALLILLLVPIYLLSEGSLVGVLSVLTIAAVLELTVTRFLLARHFFTPYWQLNVRAWKAILRESYPLAFTGIFVIIYYRIDTIMLQSMVGTEAVGHYNAAYTLLGGFTVASTAFNQSIFARLANFDKNPNAVRGIFHRSLGWMGALGGLLAISVFLLSTPIIRLLYGAEFLGASDQALRVLAWTLLFMFMSSLCGTFLNASGHQHFSMRVTAVVAGFNIGLNFFFIPKMSYVGASITTVLSYGIGLIIMYIYIRRKIFPSVVGQKT